MSDLQHCFTNRKSRVFMAHLVAGYPSINASVEIARTLIENGADILEVQIPFTDPLADGPSIMNACSKALEAGTTPESSFNLVRKITREYRTPVVIMSYCSIPLKTGLPKFVERTSQCGAVGLIVPDLPFDSDEGRQLHRLCLERGISLIPVVSPGMEEGRLSEVLSRGSGFVYATLKVGITGSSKSFARGESFLEKLSKLTELPVVAGFGISNEEEAGRICGLARGAVVGSHLLRLLNSSGIEAVGGFVKEVSNRIQKAGQNV